jgi:7,8-dihydroneopterin aldolase/epimerase/oxygenase
MRFSFANDMQGHYCVLVDRLKIDMLIGVRDFEKVTPQRVEVSLQVYAKLDKNEHGVKDYVSYSDIVRDIEAETQKLGHIELLENYADLIAKWILRDERVRRVVVEVIKTEIMKQTDGVGVMIDIRR